MLSFDEVRGLAEQVFSAAAVDDAVSAVSAGWELRLNDDGPVRVGGPASMAESEPWPTDSRGVPLTFVASIPTEHLAGYDDAWQTHSGRHLGPGTLRVFADLVSSPYETCSAKVDLVGPEIVLVDREPPPIPDPWPADPDRAGQEGNGDDVDADERLTSLAAERFSPTPALMVDRLAFEATEPDDLDLLALDRFCETVNTPLAQAFGAPKVFGVPDPIQDDPRFAASLVFDDAPDDDLQSWWPLIELHIDDAAYTICLAESDVSAGTYSRAFCDVANG